VRHIVPPLDADVTSGGAVTLRGSGQTNVEVLT
jgi:hypothetical protein